MKSHPSETSNPEEVAVRDGQTSEAIGIAREKTVVEEEGD